NEIISGYPDGTFKPAQNINFAEASKIVVNAFGYETVDDAVWYRPYVEKLAELNAIPESIDGFDHKVTRGEMVEMIYRLREKLTDKPSQTYAELADNDSGTGGTSTGGSQGSGEAPMVGNCSIFPADNAWNRDISGDPLDTNSANYISYIEDLGGNQFLHADFGGGGEYGIPYIVVGADEPLIPIDFMWWPEQSDPGPYPIPGDAPVEGGSDAHVLAVEEDNCMLYELYAAEFSGGQWHAGSGAVFDLASNDLRPDGWTSADAAGLPILPGLVRYDEVLSGGINHAIRVTFSTTQRGYIHPATHFASDVTDPDAPPMGLRMRLKADYDISGFTGQTRVILEALKKYGLIVADNGSNWFITGSANVAWDDEDLNQLKTVPGSAFEVVASGEILTADGVTVSGMGRDRRFSFFPLGMLRLRRRGIFLIAVRIQRNAEIYQKNL
ncbi:MAG TPA: S-layer homology domain-containing protein, partial [Candidatus Gracilibacteria bacterium]|nr:S-layer homology domain-containing protein [Candidatus Gracilibacteria bacterium]